MTAHRRTAHAEAMDERPVLVATERIPTGARPGSRPHARPDPPNRPHSRESPVKTTLTYIGTATVLIEAGGLNLLTDPAFDHAPTEYPTGPVTLRSLVGPALAPQDLPALDAILLSHDEHPDNLDAAGRALLAGRTVLTTVSGARRLGDGAIGLAPGRPTNSPATGAPCSSQPPRADTPATS